MELLVVVAIIALIAAMAGHSFQEAICMSKETAALKAIQTIHTAQAQYQSQFDRYATTLTELGPSPSRKPGNPSAAGLILADLASGEKSGYRYLLQPTADGYAIHASPLKFGTSGRRTFFSDQTGGIHQNWGTEPATEQSPLVN